MKTCLTISKKKHFPHAPLVLDAKVWTECHHHANAGDVLWGSS